MTLVEVFHANDKIITQRYSERRLHEIDWAANRIQTFILLNNFEGEKDA